MFEFNFFPLGLEPLLLAVWGLILRCPTKVADRRMTIGRCRWQLPEIRSSCNNEEDFSLLAMNTEAIRRQPFTFASENLAPPTAKVFKDKQETKKPLQLRSGNEYRR